MPEFIEKRPTAVTVIGWFWIIVGGLMVLSGGMGSLAFMAWGASEHFADSDRAPKLFTFMFQHFVVIAGVQGCFGALAAVAGWHFLRLRTWARSILEILSWVGLVCFVSWVVAFNIASGSMHRGEGVDSFSVFRIVIAVVSIVIYGVPLGFIIYFLRSAKVRDAVRLVQRQA